MKILASLIKWIKTSNIALVALTIMVIITVSAWMVLPGRASEGAATEETSVEAEEGGKVSDSAFGLGLLAAAISTSVSAIAAGIAVSIVGSAAMGAVAEKPEIMGRSIIFVGLAEGIAIYGLIISIMILGKL